MLITCPRYTAVKVKLLSLVVLSLVAGAGCAGQGLLQLNQPPQSQAVINPPTAHISDNTAVLPLPAEDIKPIAPPEYNSLPEPGAPVRITLVHYRGTIQPLGCCSPGMYETDEFVVIQNFSDRPQDMRGWKLTNITKSYPTFTFPEYFPCVSFQPADVTPYSPGTPQLKEQDVWAGEYPARSFSAPKSLEQRLAAISEAEGGKLEDETVKIDWTQCGATEQLDETRMIARPGQQGMSLPCILYPGQSVLVFTDEIHCKQGGFSFGYGLGNIWNNTSADTAVLYNAKGEEMSRRSYRVN